MPTSIATTTPLQIEALISTLETMLSALEEEHRALHHADALALEDIAARKALTVEKISCLYEELKHCLGIDRDSVNPESMTQTFTATLEKIRTTMPQLAERLDQLLALTRACRLSNQNNGTLVNLGLHNCQANLTLLQGLSQPALTHTYGPQAQPDDSLSSLHHLQLRA